MTPLEVAVRALLALSAEDRILVVQFVGKMTAPAREVVQATTVSVSEPLSREKYKKPVRRPASSGNNTAGPGVPGEGFLNLLIQTLEEYGEPITAADLDELLNVQAGTCSKFLSAGMSNGNHPQLQRKEVRDPDRNLNVWAYYIEKETKP